MELLPVLRIDEWGYSEMNKKEKISIFMCGIAGVKAVKTNCRVSDNCRLTKTHLPC